MLAAGRAAVIALSEIGFAWLLDVTVLREPTNALAAAGTLTVFLGGALAATGAAARSSTAPSRGSKSASIGLDASTVESAEAELGGLPEQRRGASLAAADGARAVVASDWEVVHVPSTMPVADVLVSTAAAAKGAEDGVS